MSEDLVRTSRVLKPWRWMLAVGWFVAVAAIVYCADERLFQWFFAFVSGHPPLDKVGHFLLMGGMAFAFNLGLDLKSFSLVGRRWLLGSTIVVILCTLEEFSQLCFPSRTFDLGDLTADYLGILLFGWLARRLFSPRTQV